MRAFPALSFLYLGAIACGNVAPGLRAAEPLPRGAVARGEASGPQLALRNCCQVIPFRSPEDCAALYFTLHSCIVNADKGRSPANPPTTAITVTQKTAVRELMIRSSSESSLRIVPALATSLYRYFHGETGAIHLSSHQTVYDALPYAAANRSMPAPGTTDVGSLLATGTPRASAATHQNHRNAGKVPLGGPGPPEAPPALLSDRHLPYRDRSRQGFPGRKFRFLPMVSATGL
jgi:hypothetical protein